jgi:hypothetical protein
LSVPFDYVDHGVPSGRNSRYIVKVVIARARTPVLFGFMNFIGSAADRGIVSVLFGYAAPSEQKPVAAERPLTSKVKQDHWIVLEYIFQIVLWSLFLHPHLVDCWRKLVKREKWMYKISGHIQSAFKRPDIHVHNCLYPYLFSHDITVVPYPFFKTNTSGFQSKFPFSRSSTLRFVLFRRHESVLHYLKFEEPKESLNEVSFVIGSNMCVWELNTFQSHIESK